MSLDPALFDKLLFLARLSVSDAERDAIMSTFTHTLEMIDSMHEAPTENIEPLRHPLEQNLQLREDTARSDFDQEKLQACAPAVSGGCYLVPRVIE